MAKSFSVRILNNKLGQGVVEYILLMAVISSLGYTFYNNKKFKEFISGKDGLFLSMRKGMAYSYRYGRELNSEVDYDEAMGFSYQSAKHDTYQMKDGATSHFFTGIDAYGSN